MSELIPSQFPPSFFTLAGEVTAEIEVKRSRFRCHLAPLGWDQNPADPQAGEAAARAVIEQVRRHGWDARHHCSAFIVDPRGAIERSSDDGEPSGTAGAPMLEVLRGAELTNVVAVVSRWFGGTLLGTGGLVRAYGDAVRHALAVAQRVEYRLMSECTVSLPAAEAGRVEAEMRRRGFGIVGTDWGSVVSLTLAVPPHQRAQLVAALAESSGGQAGAVVDRASTWVRA